MNASIGMIALTRDTQGKFTAAAYCPRCGVFHETAKTPDRLIAVAECRMMLRNCSCKISH